MQSGVASASRARPSLRRVFPKDLQLDSCTAQKNNFLFLLFFLQKSLSVLNISNNNIDELEDLAVLEKLSYLRAADNQIQDVKVLK